jgi:hypothetical protein
VVLGFELKAFCLLGEGSATWATSPVLFALAIFHIGSTILLFTFPLYLGWQACATIPNFYWLRYGLTNFLSRLASGLEPLFSWSPPTV